jgi:hypothetical protein
VLASADQARTDVLAAIGHGVAKPTQFSHATPPAATVGTPYVYRLLANGQPAPTYVLAEASALPPGHLHRRREQLARVAHERPAHDHRQLNRRPRRGPLAVTARRGPPPLTSRAAPAAPRRDRAPARRCCLPRARCSHRSFHPSARSARARSQGRARSLRSGAWSTHPPG